RTDAPRAVTQAAPPPAVTIPAAPPTAPPVPPGQRGRFIVLNFDNADIETVVHAASEIVGFNYVIGPGVSGKKVTVQTSGRIPQEDVFGVLLAILEVHGVTAVRSGNLYKIVPIEGARERAVPTIVGATSDPTRTGDEVVTQIVPVRFAAVTELGTLLRPLISAKGPLIANREAGAARAARHRARRRHRPDGRRRPAPSDRGRAPLELADHQRAQGRARDHPPRDREARRQRQRRAAGLHLLRGERQGQGPGGHSE